MMAAGGSTRPPSGHNSSGSPPALMTADSPNIDPLLSRLRAGDTSALGDLFALFGPQLRRMVELRLDTRLAQRVAPSDVLQEAYLAALARWEHYFRKEGLSFYVWL